MFELTEIFKQAFDTSLLERAPSAARLAAEAFFAPRSEPASEPSVAPVVVKRLKLEHSPWPATHAAAEPSDRTRQPRVFRLPASSTPTLMVTANDTAASGNKETAAVVRDVEQNRARAAAPRGTVRRRKRRALHGEVTVIRPAKPVTAGVEVVSLSDLADEQTASASASHDITVDHEAHAAATAPQWPRYLHMRQQLLALRAEAQAARALEAEAALHWIHKAIVEYDLTAADLGLTL